MSIKAIVFDAYGTLYDVHSVYNKTEELCPGKGDLISQIWRLKQLEYTWLQTSLQDYRFSDATGAYLVVSIGLIENGVVLSAAWAEETARGVFRDVDIDGDGQVTFGEFFHG